MWSRNLNSILRPLASIQRRLASYLEQNATEQLSVLDSIAQLGHQRANLEQDARRARSVYDRLNTLLGE